MALWALIIATVASVVSTTAAFRNCERYYYNYSSTTGRLEKTRAVMPDSAQYCRPYFQDPVRLRNRRCSAAAGHGYEAQVQQDRTPALQKDNGFFVDLAANDWKNISNSYYFESCRGWGGICIEPNPQYLPGLVGNRSCDVVVNPISSKDGEIVNFSLKHWYGSIVAEKEKDVPMASYVTVTLGTVLRQLNAPRVIDFLSLDVEGGETLVIKGTPLDSYVFNVFNVERPEEELHNILTSKGYVFMSCFSGFGDCFYFHKSFPDFDKHKGEYAEHNTRWFHTDHLYLLK